METFPDFENDALLLDHTVVGPLSNNVYFLTCKATGESLMVDAATDANDLLVLCRERDVRQVVVTHGHWDHIGAVAEVRGAGIPVVIGEADADAAQNYDGAVRDGQEFAVGKLRVRATATPGHTPGSICYDVAGQPLLFTGDTLFPGGPGATHFPGGHFPTIIESLRVLYSKFGDETLVLPGHGASTTIGAEVPHLDEWIRKYGP